MISGLFDPAPLHSCSCLKSDGGLIMLNCNQDRNYAFVISCMFYVISLQYLTFMAIFSSVENGPAEDGTNIYVVELTGNLAVQNGQRTRKTEIGKERYM